MSQITSLSNLSNLVTVTGAVGTVSIPVSKAAAHNEVRFNHMTVMHAALLPSVEAR